MSGTLGILEQEMASLNPLLPGARKSIPYVAETGRRWVGVPCSRLTDYLASGIFLEND